MKIIDYWLDRITMYRLVLYYLIFLVGVAVALSFGGILGYDPFAMLFTAVFLVFACWLTNWVFAKAFAVPANAESVYISALILALIITPLASLNDLWFLVWASVWAMASKYIVAIDKRHIFNPIAFAVALTYFAINQAASWWIGSPQMLFFVLIGGLVVVRKIRRFTLVFAFLVSALTVTFLLSLLTGDEVISTMQRTLLSAPLLFFAFVILTEPLTTPPTQSLRVGYGALVGVLSAPQIHLGSFYITPEIAILIGNIFSVVVSSRTTLVLTLKEKIQLAPDVFDFVFVPSHRLAYAPGQYMEWTLGLDAPDSRGNRRYFTLASSPTEENLRLGVKFSKNSSAFKQAMLSLKKNREIVASQLAGEFVLPSNPHQKCVFIAGGIGITPFRSMFKYLLDLHEPRPITLFYVNRSVADIVYRDVLDWAQRELGIKTVFAVTDPQSIPREWQGRTVGRVTPQLVKEQVPDYQECLFYISGSQGMVDSFKTLLRQLNVHSNHIKTDFFAGLS